MRMFVGGRSYGGAVAVEGATEIRTDASDPTPPVSRTASLSPSRAAAFKSCPLRYRLRVIDGLPEPASAQAVRGTLVHSVLEGLFDLPAAERTLAKARAAVEPAWAELRASDPDAPELFSRGGAGDGATEADGASAEAAWLESAGDLLEHYFGLEDPRLIEPARREEYVECTLGDGLVLRGIVDRLDEAPTGALRVVDYKTGKAPGENWEARALFQLKFYALVLWRTRGIVPAVLQLLYLADTQRLTYAPDERELAAFEKQLLALWQAVDRALETGDFRASKSALCRFCAFQQWCPEFGNSPPPYPGRDHRRPGDAAASRRLATAGP